MFYYSIRWNKRKDIKTNILFVTVVMRREMLHKVFSILVPEWTFSEFLLIEYMKILQYSFSIDSVDEYHCFCLFTWNFALITMMYNLNHRKLAHIFFLKLCFRKCINKQLRNLSYYTETTYHFMCTVMNTNMLRSVPWMNFKWNKKHI